MLNTGAELGPLFDIALCGQVETNGPNVSPLHPSQRPSLSSASTRGASAQHLAGISPELALALSIHGSCQPIFVMVNLCCVFGVVGVADVRFCRRFLPLVAFWGGRAGGDLQCGECGECADEVSGPRLGALDTEQSLRGRVALRECSWRRRCSASRRALGRHQAGAGVRALAAHDPCSRRVAAERPDR